MANTAQLAKRYAHAIARVSSVSNADNEVIVKKIVTHLKQVGRMKLLPHIARSLEREQALLKAQAPKVEIAREEERDIAIKALHTSGISVTNIITNPKLIRGWRARANGKLIDHSAKHSLIELYRNIIR